MDKEILVKKIKEAISSLKKSDGELSLFMLIADDPNSIDSKYNILISAKWLDNKEHKEGLSYIIKRLFDVINDKAYLSYISRITIIKSDNNFVKAINRVLQVTDSDVTITNNNFNGVIIEDAILFESKLANTNNMVD